MIKNILLEIYFAALKHSKLPEFHNKVNTDN